MMRHAPDVKTLLEKAHPRLKHYITRLEAENANLQRRITKLDSTLLTLRSRVKALEQETKKGTIGVAINRDDVNW